MITSAGFGFRYRNGCAPILFETLEARRLFSAVLGPEWTGPIQGHQDFRATAVSTLDVNPVLLEFTGFVSADQYNTSIHWGDGTETTGTLTSLGNHQWALSGSHRYDKAGVYNVNFEVSTVADNGDSMGSWTYLAAGKDGIQQIGTTPHANAGENNRETDHFTFTDTGMGDDTQYRAIIDWGDGHTSEGRVTTNQNMGEVWGTPPHYAVAGDHSATVTVQRLDSTGHVETSKAIDVVVEYNFTPIRLSWPGKVGAPIYAPDGHVRAALVEFTALQPLDQYSSEVDWGDGTSSSAAIVDTGRVDAEGHAIFAIVGDHQYAAGDHSYGLDVSVRTIDGHEGGFGSGVITGSDRLIAPAPIAADDYRLWADNGDPGSLDLSGMSLVTFEDPTGTDHDYAITIDWGDGTITAGRTMNPRGSEVAVMGDHEYAAHGDYHLSIHISRTSTDGGLVQATYDYTLKIIDWNELGTYDFDHRHALNVDYADAPIGAAILPILPTAPLMSGSSDPTPEGAESNSHGTIGQPPVSGFRPAPVTSLQSLVDQEDRFDDFI